MAEANSQSVIRVAVVDTDVESYQPLDGVVTAEGRAVQIVTYLKPDQDLAAEVRKCQPDILLLDGDDPNLDAMEWTGKITVANLPVACVLVWGQEDTKLVRGAMRAGAEDFLVRPLEPEQFASACDEVCAIVRERHPMGWGMGAPDGAHYCQVTGYVCGKSGVGKTTLATNVSVLLASDRAKRTAIVDLQPGYAAVLLNVKPGGALADLTDLGDELDIDSLRTVSARHDSGVDLYSWVTQPNFRQVYQVPPEFLQMILQTLASEYDHITVIFPRVTGETGLQALKIMDDVVVVTTGSDLLTLRDTKMFVDTIEDGYVEKENIRILLNRHGKTSSFTQDDVEKTIHRSVTAAIPSDYAVTSASINMGVPFVNLKPSSPLTQSIREVATVLSGGQVAAGDESPRGFRLFGRK